MSRQSTRAQWGLRLLVVVLVAPGVVGNLRSENEALRTSLRAAVSPQAPFQAMQEEQQYAASQQVAEQQEEQYVQQQQQYARAEEQQFAANAAHQVPQPALQQAGYEEQGEVQQPAAAPTAAAAPWPAASYNTGEPLVTRQTEEDARK